MIFDIETGFLNLDQRIVQNKNFKKIMEDQEITDPEIEEQSQKVIFHLKELESLLSSDDLDRVCNTMVELGVLFTISHIKELNNQ